jgi:hypothetical protein
MHVGRLLVFVAEVDEDLRWRPHIGHRGFLGASDDLLEEGSFSALLRQGNGLRACGGLLLRKFIGVLHRLVVEVATVLRRVLTRCLLVDVPRIIGTHGRGSIY